YLRQPDGTLTTALMPEKDGGAEPKTVEQFWKAIFGDFDPNGSGHGAGQKRGEHYWKGVEHYWKGRMPLGELLTIMTRPEVRLLRMSTLRIGGGEERRYVSLGHDALARVAADWDEEFARRVRMLGSVLACAVVSAACLACLILYAVQKFNDIKERI